MNAHRSRMEAWLFAAAVLHGLVLAPWPMPFFAFAGQAQTTLFVELQAERADAPDRTYANVRETPGQEKEQRHRRVIPPQTVTAEARRETIDRLAYDAKETMPRESVSSEPPQKDAPMPMHDMNGQPTAAKRAEIQARLRTDLARHFEYPAIAQRRGWEGRVVLRFMVEPEGRLEGIQIAKTSGYDVLDQAARRALERVERLQEAAGTLDSRIEMELPVIYRLQEH